MVLSSGWKNMSMLIRERWAILSRLKMLSTSSAAQTLGDKVDWQGGQDLCPTMRKTPRLTLPPFQTEGVQTILEESKTTRLNHLPLYQVRREDSEIKGRFDPSFI